MIQSLVGPAYSKEGTKTHTVSFRKDGFMVGITFPAYASPSHVIIRHKGFDRIHSDGNYLRHIPIAAGEEVAIETDVLTNTCAVEYWVLDDNSNCDRQTWETARKRLQDVTR